MQHKSALVKTVKTISFLTVLTLLIASFSYMLAPKDNTENSGINNPNANGFFSEPANSIDIAFIGNSDAYSGFSPMELWNKYGYTSYVAAEGKQNLSQSYNMLKKMLNNQKPKLLVLETDEFFSKSRLTQSAANIINASMGSAFSVFQYHDRWKRVKLKDLLRKPDYTAHCVSKGQKLCNDIDGYLGGEYMVKTDKVAKIPISTKTGLDAIIKLCARNNIKLLLVELPSESSWNYAKHNAVQKLADQKGITFLDLNVDREAFEFDWKKDTRDRGNHLNNSGARKATLFIGKHIEDNFSIPNHKNDKQYKAWHNDYSDYKKQVRI